MDQDSSPHPSQQCPSTWTLITTPVRGCGRSVTSCESAFFPSNGRSYSRVCGRVLAYQKGDPEALLHRNIDLEGAYIDGVSLTHGAAGSRQHIWSFVVASYETYSNYNPQHNCPCTNINVPWPYQIPSFVGNDYFCETGNPGPEQSTTVIYADDPLWDGEGCGPTSACCEFNNPPWFCTTLPQPTTDDIELRICAANSANNEDAVVTFIDVNIM